MKFRAGQGHAFATVFQGTAEIADRVPGIEIIIMRKQVRLVLRNDDIAIGRDNCVGGKGEVDAGSKLPAAQIYGVGSFVVEFDKLIVAVLGNGIVHQLIDNDVVDDDPTIGC